MKSGVKLAVVVESIMGFAPQMGGIFSAAELSSMIAGGNDLVNQRMMKNIVEAGIVSRVLKGLYVTKNCDLWTLSSRISENSYVSMDSALARAGLTGSVPQRSLSVIYTGKKRTVKTPSGAIHFYSISPDLFFGFSKLASGTNLADSEKAYIDMLYFYVKGASFLIDPLKDVSIEKFNKKKLIAYLKRYRNPKFVKFVKGTL
ncbi:MAG: hypothetical protein COV46_05575 [Deltaproteobacteria bacterium CG11_big_fil_rev_8_21_14_0_20_49_13]|nr:MAG: hypothetical protein COV46_05575 [Deltaproteobacteria bacterium CG11_big_fil_rev_8_21_14_0_20_49_13]